MPMMGTSGVKVPPVAVGRAWACPIFFQEWIDSLWRPLPSSERAADVILRVLLAGIAEDPLGFFIFHEITRAAPCGRINIKKCGAVRNALSLVQVVRDDDDGVLFLELLHQLFDFACRDRIERGARLVHEKDFRL